MAFFFHWIDVGTTEAEWLTAATWNPAYATNDEDVLTFRIDHEEGQIPSMSVQVRNPQIGLLNPTRKLWAWMSWNGNGYAEPLFFGRLVGIPTDLLAEAVTLQFTARHRNFVINKQVAAEGLKVRPYYDPIFIDLMKRDDPDAILEGYSALWHVDRVDLGVTPSDVLVGEDGNAIFLEDEVPYESVQINLNQVPLNAVYVSAEVNWNQEFSGYIDTGTQKLSTFSGDGIMAEWPRPASSLGGGWSVVSSFIKDLNKISNVLTISYSTSWQNREKQHNTADVMSVERSRSYPNFSPGTEFVSRRITYQQVIGLLDANTRDSDGDPSPTNIPESLEYTETYVPQFKLKYSMGLRYDAARTRTERIEFTLNADTQAVLSDPLLDQETDNVSLPGADVGLPIISFRNWSSIAGRYVGLGEFIFPDNPDVAGQKSIQVSIISGVAGTTIPVFSNVAGVTTQDGTVTWSSLGSANGIYNISADWSRETLVPLGEIILPRVPFSLLYKDFVNPGRMQDPEVGVGVSLNQIVEVPNKGFFQCTLSGTTDDKNPTWKTDGSITKDGTVEWTFIGPALPTGIDYFICTTSGVTAEYLPRFGEGHTLVNDGTVVWTKLPASEVPVGGAPGKTPRNDYFPTDRGRRSIEYLLCLARARLRIRSRAVQVSFDCRFERATKLSCRMNATIYDRRLPGGVATGKIISYSLSADGDKGELIGKITIGCAVGNGSSLSIVTGDPVYAEDGYVTPGYQEYTGSTVPAGNDIGYTPPASNATDLFNYPLTPDQVFPGGGFVTRGTLSAQKNGINKALNSEWVAANLAPTSITNAEKSLQAQQLAMQAAANSVQIKLQENPIWIELELKPVSGISYDNFYSIVTTDLPIPKMIDLEAASNATPPSVGSNIVYASAAFTGVGNVNYSGTQPWRNATAAFGGAGSVGAIGNLMRPAKAMFSGVGNEIAKATAGFDSSYLDFYAYSSLSVLATVLRPAEKSMDAVGTMGVNAIIPTVAFDAFTPFTVQAGANFSFTHTPVGQAKGVLVFITGTVGTDTISSVTYGGVPMYEVNVSPNLKAAAEAGAVYAYFLGDNIPAGAQTVSVVGTASGTKNAYAYTVTGSPGRNITIADAEIINSNSITNPSVTLSLDSRNAFCALAFTSGVDAIGSATPTTNWTTRSETDHGTQVAGSYSYDIIGTADVAAGWTQAADDAVMIAVALVEGTLAGARADLVGEGTIAAEFDDQSATVLLAGAGSMVTGAVAEFAPIISLDGSGSLGALATIPQEGAAVFNGAGNMLADAGAQKIATASFAGDGQVQIILAEIGNATLSGAGTMSADTTVSTPIFGDADLSGEGTMGATAGQSLSAQGYFAGAGGLGTATEQAAQAAASLAGAGSMTEAGAIPPSQANLGGSGSLVAEAEAADPNFASVVALVGMSGENGSTVFKDDSSYARAVTTAGDAQVSSAQMLFGNNTGTFDATGDYLSIAHSTDLAVSNTTDKTIEIWFRMTTGGRINTLVNKRPASSAHEFAFVVDTNDKLAFYCYASGSAVLAITGTTTVSTNTWYHAAAVRTTGGAWAIYLDGVQEATGTQSSTPSAGGTALLIGRDGSNTGRDWAGQLSEMRYTNFARYTAAFTPPAAPFPRDWTYAKATFGGSGSMVSQAVNPADLSDRLLEDNASFRLLEDGTSKRLLE